MKVTLIFLINLYLLTHSVSTQNCDVAILGCIECDVADPNVCTKCDPTFETVPIANVCSCLPNTYVLDQICVTCDKAINNCITCLGPQEAVKCS